MWVEGSDPQNTFDRQVVVYGKGDHPIFIRAYYGCYDPLAYPLFFPRGETGWNRRIPYETPPKVAQEDNEDGTELQDWQGEDQSSNVHLEQNIDEEGGNYPHAFKKLLILFIISVDHPLIIFNPCYR
jgi:hypothetical protein